MKVKVVKKGSKKPAGVWCPFMIEVPAEPLLERK
jgi:hypothetical protein